jgi:hypothetical protein
MKRVLYGIGIFLGLYLAAGFLFGRGPRVDIPADAQIGREYPFADEEAIAQETFQLVLSSIKDRYKDGKMLRDAHPDAHGCVKAEFKVHNELPAELRHGIFASPASYPAWIRYSNGQPLPRDDAGNIRGMAIKLMNVPGPKLMSDEKNTHDFLLINHPVLPVGSPADYMALFKAAINKAPLGGLLGLNPFQWKLGALNIVIKIRRKKIANMLALRYWSTVPYRLGSGAVKYSARPCEPFSAELPENPPARYLRGAMADTLAHKSACFEFMVQLQKDAIAMPVEDPAVEWDENDSPFIPVARIEIPRQQFDSAAQNAFCENLSFGPWHALDEHRPLGGINRVRRVAYEGVSRFRHEQNKIPLSEPTGQEHF